MFFTEKSLFIALKCTRSSFSVNHINLLFIHVLFFYFLMIKVHFYLDFVLFFPDMVYDSLIKAAVGNFGVKITFLCPIWKKCHKTQTAISK